MKRQIDYWLYAVWSSKSHDVEAIFRQAENLRISCISDTEILDKTLKEWHELKDRLQKTREHFTDIEKFIVANDLEGFIEYNRKKYYSTYFTEVHKSMLIQDFYNFRKGLE